MNATIDWKKSQAANKTVKLRPIDMQRGTYSVVIVDKDTGKELYTCEAFAAPEVIRTLNKKK